MKAPPKEKATAGELALKDVSRQKEADYQSRFRPAERALIKDAELTKGERAQVKGEASADTAAAFKGMDRSTISAGAQAGAQGSSGKTKLSLAADAATAGQVGGIGQAMAEAGAEVDSQGRQIQAVGFGRDVSQRVTANLNREGVRATNLALAASEARMMKNTARLDAAASVAGAATRKYQLSKSDDKTSSLSAASADWGPRKPEPAASYTSTFLQNLDEMSTPGFTF